MDNSAKPNIRLQLILRHKATEHKHDLVLQQQKSKRKQIPTTDFYFSLVITRVGLESQDTCQDV